MADEQKTRLTLRRFCESLGVASEAAMMHVFRTLAMPTHTAEESGNMPHYNRSSRDLHNTFDEMAW